MGARGSKKAEECPEQLPAPDTSSPPCPEPPHLTRQVSLPTLPEVIEELGVGLAQVKIAALAGAVWLADGCELLLISSIKDAVAEDWDLTHFQEGALVSLVFIGIFIGNLVSGPLSDMFGRRLPIILSFFLIVVFSGFSALSFDFWSLSFSRLLVGSSFGIGQPAFQTMMTESSPASGRVAMVSTGLALFGVGEMYSALLLMADDPYLEKLHWRFLLMMGAIPALIFGTLCWLFLSESPLYLYSGGYNERASAVLAKMRDINRMPSVPINFKPHEENPEVVTTRKGLFLHELRTVLSADMLVTTITLVYTCFVLNFCFYGCQYAFPTILKNVDMFATPAANLFMTGVWDVVGIALGIVAVQCVPRKPVMRVYLCLTSASLLLFSVCAPLNHGSFVRLLLFIGYYGIVFFKNIGFVGAYVYATEIFATPVRTTGVGLCLAGGRLGAIVAPLTFEAIEASTHFVFYFYLQLVLMVVNYFLIDCLKYETSGMTLKDRTEDLAEQAHGLPHDEPPYGATSKASTALILERAGRDTGT